MWRYNIYKWWDSYPFKSGPNYNTLEVLYHTKVWFVIINFFFINVTRKKLIMTNYVTLAEFHALIENLKHKSLDL